MLKRTAKTSTPLQDMNHPSTVKKTYKTKTAELVPVFAARWRSVPNTSAAQIITNPKEDYRNNYNTRKVAPSYTQKMTPKQNQKESEQNYNIFQRKLKKCTYAK